MMNANNTNNMMRKNIQSPSKQHKALFNGAAPKLGCFKLVKKDVTGVPLFVPVLPIGGVWRNRKQLL